MKGVAGLAIAKTAVTAAALAADAYAGRLGRRAAEAGDVPVESATEPASETPEDVANTLRRLKVVQWVVPALTGALVVLSARMGEQQRPQAVARGVRDRLLRRLGEPPGACARRPPAGRAQQMSTISFENGPAFPDVSTARTRIAFDPVSRQ